MLFDPSKARIVPASEVAKYSIPEEDFLLGPRFLPRGGKLMIAGDTEVGKSWICLNVVRGLVQGEPLFGNPEWPSRKCSVLYIESEVGITTPERIKMVFAESLGDPDFACLIRPDGFNLSYSQCVEWLRDQIKDRKFDAVVLDPIGDLCTVDENSNSEVNRLLMAIRDMQGQAAVVFSHHTGKAPRGEYAKDYDPLNLDNARGASKFKGSVDSCLMVSRRPGRLSPDYESWTLDARWAKTRHAKERPRQGVLRFNEIGNGRMYWRYETTTKSSSKIVSIASGEKPDTPWS